MKLIIDISEDTKNRLCFGVTYAKDIQTVCEALHNGIPLPKGHGKLIDADELNEQEIPAIKKDGVVYVKLSTLQNLIDNAPTIIEADMERKNKSCSNCKYWLLDKNDENRKCKICFEMDEWVAESER